MNESQSITVMQRELGRQLAALRREAGLTQQALAVLTGFSRSAVSLAEISRQFPARLFWQACDKALNANGVLAAGADQISAVRDAEQRAAALAAQEAREARALAALTAARQRSGVTAGITALQACPHCGGQIAVLTTLIPQTAPPAQHLSTTENPAQTVTTRNINDQKTASAITTPNARVALASNAKPIAISH